MSVPPQSSHQKEEDRARRPLEKRRHWSLKRRRHVPEILQMNQTECGAACLAMLLQYYGYRVGVASVSERCGVGRDGLSARTIAEAARDYGLRVRAISMQRNDFHFVMLPAILHWDFNHFVVLERWTPARAVIVDPAYGRTSVSANEFDQHFTGIVLLMEPGAHFAPFRLKRPLSLWSYLRSILHLPRFLLQILVASLLLQLLGLALPLLTKLLVDSIIPLHIDDLMPMLGLGLLFIMLTQLVTTFLRASLLVYLQARVDMQMMLGFFEHLLSLPYHFFQQRSSGDLLSRMNSNIVIRDIFTSRLLSTLLDGSFVLLYLLILFSQSVLMAALALALGATLVGLLLATARFMRDLTRRDLTAQGKAQGYMAEALTSIATLKATGAEHQVLQRWSNLFFAHLNASVRRDYLASLLNSLTTTLSVFASLLLLWFGTLQVLHGTMSVGTMLALNSLAAAFLVPLTSLASGGQELQTVPAHFERIADVVTAQPEQDPESVQQPLPLRGEVTLRDVSFRYDAQAPWVLRKLSLHIEPGQKIALVGRTGSGKSTLGKLLLGLYTPTEGEILYDDVPLHRLNYRAVRSQFGAVLQENHILSTSIRENIAFREPGMDLEQIKQAARLAAIHDEIVQMPLGYETLVAEGGNALSGGQRQRLALARALANKPIILLLDEATSHLDVVTERIVDDHLNALACTRIIIAHRLSTIRNADAILVLDQGTIVEQGTHADLMQQGGLYAQLVQTQFAEEQGRMRASPEKEERGTVRLFHFLPVEHPGSGRADETG